MTPCVIVFTDYAIFLILFSENVFLAEIGFHIIVIHVNIAAKEKQTRGIAFPHSGHQQVVNIKTST